MQLKFHLKNLKRFNILPIHSVCMRRFSTLQRMESDIIKNITKATKGWHVPLNFTVIMN